VEFNYANTKSNHKASLCSSQQKYSYNNNNGGKIIIFLEVRTWKEKLYAKEELSGIQREREEEDEASTNFCS